MPIPQTIYINPLDLQGNIAIGISLPFNGPAGPFNSTYSTQEQAKYNLINLLLTNKGERVFNPEFGTDLRPVLFEPITEDIVSLIQSIVTTSVDTYVPEVVVSDIIVKKDEDYNLISITITYRMRISGQTDQITVQFI